MGWVGVLENYLKRVGVNNKKGRVVVFYLNGFRKLNNMENIKIINIINNIKNENNSTVLVLLFFHVLV